MSKNDSVSPEMRAMADLFTLVMQHSPIESAEGTTCSKHDFHSDAEGSLVQEQFAAHRRDIVRQAIATQEPDPVRAFDPERHKLSIVARAAVKYYKKR